MDTTNRIESGLKPRAIAVLCARIGDSNQHETASLADEMEEIGLLGRVTKAYWYLNHNGVGWLETNGLTVAREARLWVASEELDK